MLPSRETIATICIALLTVAVLAATRPAEPAAVQESSSPADELSLAQAVAFQDALQQSLKQNAASTLEAIAAQDEVLARIDSNIAEIAKREAAAEQEAAAKAAAKQEAAAKAAALPEVVRRSSTIWNVEGSWNYTTEQLAAHLQNSHGLNVDGYTREEMKIMHDNLHNGYSATGDSVAEGGTTGTRSATKQYTYYYVEPQKQRRGLFQTIFGTGSCPNGYCR